MIKKKSVIKTVIIILASIIGITVMLVGLNYYQINNIKTSKYQIYSSKIPLAFNGYKIAFVSDYHNAEYVQQAVKNITDAKPDVILFGGDMVTLGEDSYDNTIALFSALKEVAPMYFVTGNHEIFHSKLSQIKIDFKNVGVKILNNEAIKLEKGGEYISLFGMNDLAIQDVEIPSLHRNHAILQVAIKKVDFATYNMLLVHRANMFEKIHDFGYDGILAGHMHGGLVRLPFVGGVFSPERDVWFPKYTKGEYFMGHSKMIVSGGMDKTQGKMRIFNQPELLIIELFRA